MSIDSNPDDDPVEPTDSNNNIVKRSEFDLEDGVLYDSSRRQVMNVNSVRDELGVNMENYTCTERPQEAGDRFALMVHLRKVRHYYGIALKMTVAKAKEKHGADITYGTLSKAIEQMLVEPRILE